MFYITIKVLSMACILQIALANIYLGQPEWFDPGIVIADLLGVVRQGGLFFHKHWCDQHGWNLLIYIYIFTRCGVHYLELLRKFSDTSSWYQVSLILLGRLHIYYYIYRLSLKWFQNFLILCSAIIACW